MRNLSSVPDQCNAFISNTGLFPHHIRVYPAGPTGANASVLPTCFMEPLSKKDMEKFAGDIAAYLKQKEVDAVFSFFSRYEKKSPAGSGWQLSCCRLNIGNNNLEGEVVVFTYDLDLLGEIKERLYRVLENDTFYKENLSKIARLTKKEKEILGLLAEGMNSREIASTLCVSVHTVNTHRKHINEKLAISQFSDLLKVADIFDLATAKQTL